MNKPVVLMASVVAAAFFGLAVVVMRQGDAPPGQAKKTPSAVPTATATSAPPATVVPVTKTPVPGCEPVACTPTPAFE